MTVKQRLMINTAAMVLSVIGIIAAIFLTAYLVMRAMDANRVADLLITTSFERLVLRSDYIRTGSERAREQIVAKNRQVTDLLKSAESIFTDSEDNKIVVSLIEGNRSIGKIFRAIVENRKKSGSVTPSEGFAAEVENRLLSQLDMRIYEVILLGGKLQESANDDLLSAFRIAGGGILLVVLLVGAVTMLNSVTMGRAVSGRIALLRDGAAAIGQGNLDYRINIKGDDEFTDLSREFNSMTEKLYRSHMNLEIEISERKRIGEELRMIKEGLEIRVRERTEDLIRVNEELEIEIARRKLVAEDLKYANAYNRSLIEASLDPLLTISAEGKITDINLATEKVTGLSREKIIGTDFSGYFTEPDKARAGYRKAFSAGSVIDYPLEIRHRTGLITPVLYNAAVYRDESGSVIGVFAAARDISERIDAENRLFRLNRVYSILSKINEAIVRVDDPSELYRQVCRIAVEYGLFRMAWIGLKDHETLKINPVASFGDRDGYLDGICIIATDVPEGRGPTGRAVYEGKFSICSDFENDPDMLPWRDKARLHGYRSSAAFPLRVSGEVIGAFTIYSHVPEFFTDEEIYLLSSLADDISFAIDAMNNEKKRLEAEEALRTLNEELERRIFVRTADLEFANKELESFSYSVSHDLRAPLRHISGFIELLQKRLAGNIDEASLHYTNVISAASKKMGTLIDNLLVFSRIGRSEIQLKEVDLDDLTSAAISEVMAGEKERRIDWKVGKMPLVNVDASMFSLALVNLVSNAVKFTRTRPVAKIEIGCDDKDGEHVCFIRDNGVGFDMKYSDKLFGVFQRLHSLDEFEGTGIGLANVQRIIARHGGRIWADGKAGDGATFYFSIPKARGA
jgi:PAS domain S-box-containing protein